MKRLIILDWTALVKAYLDAREGLNQAILYLPTVAYDDPEFIRAKDLCSDLLLGLGHAPEEGEAVINVVIWAAQNGRLSYRVDKDIIYTLHIFNLLWYVDKTYHYVSGVFSKADAKARIEAVNPQLEVLYTN